MKLNKVRLSHASGTGWISLCHVVLICCRYDTSLFDACVALAERWVNWDVRAANPFSKSDFASFSATQIQEFLQVLLGAKDPIPVEKLKLMEDVYGFNSNRNAEIRFRYV